MRFLTSLRIIFYLLLFSLLLSSCKKEDLIVADRDGNVYNTIIIGTQVWFKENLKTTKYNDGSSIPHVTDYVDWRDLSSPGYCWYDNNESKYKETYGALYNWFAVNTAKLCPEGWHVPTSDEWSTLEDYLGGHLIAGDKLKEIGTTHWPSPNDKATDESGFTALPGGYRQIGLFGLLGYHAHWWSTSSYSAPYANSRSIHYDASSIDHIDIYKGTGCSIRCIKDQ